MTVARERILDAAYDLFSRRGIRAVGIDTIVERAGVARMTLYRHFASKDALVLAFLAGTGGAVDEETGSRREVEAEGARCEGRAAARDLDVFDGWFQRAGVRGLLVYQRAARDRRPGERPARRQRRTTRAASALRRGARERRRASPDPEAFARQWHILMKGSIFSAGEGDRSAARRAKEFGALLLSTRCPPRPSGARRPRRPPRSLQGHPAQRQDHVVDAPQLALVEVGEPEARLGQRSGGGNHHLPPLHGDLREDGAAVTIPGRTASRTRPARGGQPCRSRWSDGPGAAPRSSPSAGRRGARRRAGRAPRTGRR